MFGRYLLAMAVLVVGVVVAATYSPVWGIGVCVAALVFSLLNVVFSSY